MVTNPTDIREPGVALEPGVAPAPGAPIRQSNLWRDAWRRCVRNRGAVVAGAIFVLIVLYCVIWPFVSPYTGIEVDFSKAKQAPSLAHPLGTDKFGRDLFTRTAQGGRASILIGFGATLAILLIGGSTARSPASSAAASTTGDALPRRALRAPVSAVRDHHSRHHRADRHVDDDDRAVDRELVHDGTDRPRPGPHPEGERLRARREGGRCTLVPDSHAAPAAQHARRADHRHLPRAAGGDPRRGVPLVHRPRHQPTRPSWGAMAQEGRTTYRTHPIEIVVPSVAIATLVLCANFIADGLRDALDPRTRES